MMRGLLEKKLYEMDTTSNFIANVNTRSIFSVIYIFLDVSSGHLQTSTARGWWGYLTKFEFRQRAPSQYVDRPQVYFDF